jgi:hypothetical protein
MACRPSRGPAAYAGSLGGRRSPIHLQTLLALSLGLLLARPSPGHGQCSPIGGHQSHPLWIAGAGLTICAPGLYTQASPQDSLTWMDTTARGRALPVVWIHFDVSGRALGLGSDSLLSSRDWVCRGDCAQYDNVVTMEDVIGGRPVTLQTGLLSGTFAHLDSAPVVRIARPTSDSTWLVVDVEGRSKQPLAEVLEMACSLRWWR